MIQNLENKMELQINSLEKRIDKMQEMFNKDLEEIKKESGNNEQYNNWDKKKTLWREPTVEYLRLKIG